MFYYYLINKKDNKIICFSKDKNEVINTIPFLKHISNFNINDIIETKEELINRYNTDKEQMEIVFKKDIQE